MLIKSKIFRIYLGLIMLANIMYLSLEVYKLQVGEGLALKKEITQSDIVGIERISSLTLYSEQIIILLFIASAVVIFMKKNHDLVKHFLVVHLVYFAFLFVLSYLLTFIFSAPVGNLTEQLIFPITILFAIFVYYLFNSIYRGMTGRFISKRL